MSTWHLYALATGVFDGRTVTATAETIAARTPAGFGAIDGVADWQSQQVLSEETARTLIDYQPPAPADTADETFSWHEQTKRYVGTPTLAALKRARAAPLHWQIAQLESGQARAQRELLLAWAAQAPPEDAVAVLAVIDGAVAPLRARIQAILAAATPADLDAIAP